MKRRSRLAQLLVPCAMAVVLLPAESVPAEDARTVIKQGDFPDDLVVSGDDVTVEATVARDLLVAGGTVNVDAKVDGDLFAVGRDVDLHISAVLAGVDGEHEVA